MCRRSPARRISLPRTSAASSAAPSARRPTSTSSPAAWSVRRRCSATPTTRSPTSVSPSGCSASDRSPRASAGRSASPPRPIGPLTRRPSSAADSDLHSACLGAPAVQQLSRRQARAPRLTSPTTLRHRRMNTMLKHLTNVQVWVHDQDEALAFYTEKLGMELREDVTVPEMGNFRWLTVGVPGQPDVALVLMAVPGPPVFDAETREQILALTAKGAAGGLFFTTDDCKTSYEELKSRGVEFQQEPTEQPYGIDAGFRDPSGNQMRMVQQEA